MITYKKGDLLESLKDTQTKTLICHVCNNLGIMGKGFAQQVKEMYPSVALGFRRARLTLGPACYYAMTPTNANIYISNMVCMHGLYNKWNNPTPLDYKALEACLRNSLAYAKDIGAEIHMPKIGAGFARGNWASIVFILDEVFKDEDITIWEL